MRLFFAVDLPKETRDRLFDAASGLAGEGVTLVKRENIHITLAFVGETQESRVGRVSSVLHGIDSCGFECRMRGAGSFGRGHGVLFARIAEGGSELAAISGRLSEGLARLGIVETRAFKPHVTIARFGEGAGAKVSEFIRDRSDTDFGGFMCEGVTLKRSVLTSDGPVYSDIIVKPLSSALLPGSSRSPLL